MGSQEVGLTPLPSATAGIWTRHDTRIRVHPGRNIVVVAGTRGPKHALNLDSISIGPMS
jgi:hypothetical protein